MAGELRRLEFAVTTVDIEHWPAAYLAAAEADPDSVGYHDWAVGQLAAAMRATGQAWIDAHPDLFACDLT